MRPMKTQGVATVAELLARVRRLHALGRVARVDREFIEQRLEEVSARIVSMPETDENGREL